MGLSYFYLEVPDAQQPFQYLGLKLTGGSSSSRQYANPSNNELNVDQNPLSKYK